MAKGNTITVLALLVCCVVAPSAARTPAPQGRDGRPIRIGYGLQSCGKWITARDIQKTDETAFTQVVAMTSFIQGALFGSVLAEVARDRQEALTGLQAIPDAESIQVWTDEHCRTHALDDIANSALALYGELIKRRLEK